MDQFWSHPTRAHRPLPLTSQATAITPVRTSPYGLLDVTALQDHMPSHDNHTTMHHPCCLVSRPPSWQTWNLRVPTLFSFNLFLSYCMLMLLWLLCMVLCISMLIPDSEANCMHLCALFTSLSLPPPCRQPPSYRYPLAHVPIAYMSCDPVVLFSISSSPILLYLSSLIIIILILLKLALRNSKLLSCSLYEVSDIGCFPTTQVIAFRLTPPLVIVCVLLLDLVITLAKSHLVLVFSVEDTPVWACSISWQPSLRAFSFVTSFPYQSWPVCTLVRLENPFLTQLP